ncbi:KGG domain-containing protein [Pseudomonas sp. R2.Fl]|nr:KGG domain-containing protein [Pseudomonas sp. R2.Fl]
MSRTPLSLNPSSTNTHGTATSAPRGQEQGRRREPRGFAAMDPERQREIARKGGRAAHRSGNAHQFDSEEAREAGRKGGEAVSQDRTHMARIGARGGEARGANRRQQTRERGIEGDEGSAEPDAGGSMPSGSMPSTRHH